MDWYTVLTGLVALAALTMHGASYVALKTEGNVHTRATELVRVTWAATTALTIGSLVATLWIRSALLGNFRAHAAGWIFPAVVATALSAVPFFVRRRNDLAAFVASLLYLAGMLGGAAFALYPALIPASGDPAYSITIFNAHTGTYSMRAGLVWWSLGLMLAAGYFIFLYRSFRGKVRLGPEEL
jgi:cytochrome d ubiquinol oxidase subunit II